MYCITFNRDWKLMTRFEINETEEKTINDTIKAMKTLYGDDVNYKITYCFTSTGIGDNVKIIIKFDDTIIEKDVTDYGSW